MTQSKSGAASRTGARAEGGTARAADLIENALA